MDWRRIAKYMAGHDSALFYFVTGETENPASKLHARMIFVGGEDPATGSAAGPAAACMVKHELCRPDEEVIIEQGHEMKLAESNFCARESGGRARM